MPPLQEKIAQRLAAFQLQGNFEALTEASELTEALAPGAEASPAEQKKLRVDKLRFRLAVLNAIDARLKPEFDFDDVPEMVVTPPPETGLPAGVDASAIKDPAARSKYERAVRANQEKAREYSLQKKLRRFEPRAAMLAQQNIEEFIAIGPEETAEVKAILEKEVASDRRKSSLREFIAAWEKKNR